MTLGQSRTKLPAVVAKRSIHRVDQPNSGVRIRLFGVPRLGVLFQDLRRLVGHDRCLVAVARHLGV